MADGLFTGSGAARRAAPIALNGRHASSASDMARQFISFTTDKRFARRARSLKTIGAMVHMYCRGNDHVDRAPLCAECAALLRYAGRRLERCVFGDTKPNCADCTVHCYRADMRERIQVVMRWAGPRMPLLHPILSMAHMLAKRRPVRALPANPKKKAARDQGA